MSTNGPTYGEQMVSRLMKKLPEQFFCYAEPRIDSATATSRYPDFVIVWRDKGLICVEVKDWKKILAGDQRDIKIETSDGDIKVKENPYKTAQNYVYHLMNRLEQRRELKTKHRGDESLAFPVEPLVILTHQDKTTASWLVDEGLFPEYGVLSSADLMSVENFQRALNRMNWTFVMNHPLTDAHIETIQHTFQVVEVRTKSHADGTPGAKRGTLIEEQDNIIWAPIPVQENGISKMLVRGVVGSGKTIVLNKKADLLSRMRPDLKILLTAFNLDLAKDLSERITSNRIRVAPVFDLIEEVLGDDFPRIVSYRGKSNPKTNKTWCKENADLFDLPMDFVSMEISRRKDLELYSEARYRSDLLKRDADLSEKEIEELNSAFELYIEHQEEERRNGKGWQDYEDTAKMATKAIHGHKLHRHFDIIMVDEGQDFSPNKFNFLRSMLRPGGHLLTCDDPLQSLWRQFDLGDKGLTNADIKLLKLPLRTTREIAEAAQSLFELVTVMRTDDDNEIYPAKTDHLKVGGKPHLVRYKNRKDEIATIRDCIKQQLEVYPDEPVAVLTPEFSNDWREWCNELQDNRVYYGHFNLTKGLEFNAVFIPHLDDLFQNRWNERTIMKRWLYRKFFVAMTRARHNLYMSHIDEIPDDIKPFEHYCEVYEA